MITILSYEFMQNAILAGVLASIVCGVIGPFIVTRRMVFISGGLSHTAFGGLGIAYWLGIRPLFGATAFVLAAALLIGRMEEKRVSRNDLFIGILWAVGVAIGIIFIHITPGYAPDLMIFLFGNILTVPRTDVIIMLVLVLIVCGTVALFYNGFVAIALDEEYARARRLPVAALKMGLMILTALTIVTLIQVVGILLVIALLTIPVAVASELSDHAAVGSLRHPHLPLGPRGLLLHRTALRRLDHPDRRDAAGPDQRDETACPSQVRQPVAG
jgi:zinc transport system permease protein